MKVLQREIKMEPIKATNFNWRREGNTTGIEREKSSILVMNIDGGRSGDGCALQEEFASVDFALCSPFPFILCCIWMMK